MNGEPHYLPEDRERVKALANAMTRAIPDGTPTGYVMSALCMMLHYGMGNSPPELQDRIRAMIQSSFADGRPH